jgi:hypothetical protein
MRIHFILPFVAVLGACKGGDKPAVPAAKPSETALAAPAKSGAAPAEGLPGPCVAIPTEGDPDTTYDLDGDGVKDTVVMDMAAHCD